MPVALNVDGLERNRKKWNRAGESLVSRVGMAGDLDAERRGHRCARASPDYYRERYHRDSEMIPYGAEIGRGGDDRGARTTGPGARESIFCT